MGLVDFRRQGRIGLITLNNPSKLNVVGVGMMEDLSAAVDLGLQDADVRVLLLTGSGSAFCAGANLDGGLRNPSDDGSDQLARYMKGTLNPTLAKLACAPKPVVVAVNGAAVGAGVGLALMGDVVVAAESARFILSFARLGLGLDAGLSKLLAERIGVARARAISLLAAPLEATVAAKWGLIWASVPDHQLIALASDIAERLAANAPLAVAAIRRQIAEAAERSLIDSMDREADLQAALVQTADFKEGVSAFHQKRPAAFNGR